LTIDDAKLATKVARMRVANGQKRKDWLM
jgi:hypothetical protein